VPRRPRRELPPLGVYHVTARGAAGLPIFFADLDRVDFLSLFRSVARVERWKCHAFCLLETHYHLVLETPLVRLSSGMRHLNGTYAQRFNRRHDRRGHVFESRFVSWIVRDEEHLAAACRYVLANPVAAGLCDAVGDWPWAAVLNSDETASPAAESFTSPQGDAGRRRP
jgi:REP element-mobilizing transposase RayT